MIILAVDPGNTESAYCLYDVDAARPLDWAKLRNEEMLDFLVAVARVAADNLAVEMIASYGMSVGAEVFETCLWIGRFIQRWEGEHRLVYRREVKLHLCGSSRAKDPNVRQALIDKFGPGKERAVGLKKTPGPLYGMSGDCWSALAVAVTAAETPNPVLADNGRRE
jgi:hypothetical protein